MGVSSKFLNSGFYNNFKLIKFKKKKNSFINNNFKLIKFKKKKIHLLIKKSLLNFLVSVQQKTFIMKLYH